MTLTTVAPLEITGCGVVSPAGLGLDPLGEALRRGRPGCSDPAQVPGDESVLEPIRVVPDLHAADHLGRKGTRNLDRTTVLGLVASKLALENDPSTVAEDPSRVGVVMGSSTGSVRSSAEFARDTFVQDEPYLVNPGQFPNTVMNCCAGQIAIWNSLQGINVTVAGGQLSSLFAMRYARNALNQDAASRLLVGGVEELSPQTAQAWHRSEALPPGTAVGEGCAVFIVEPEGSRPGVARLLACEVAFSGTADRRPRLAEGLTECVERALKRSGVSPEEVSLVALSAADAASAENRIEERALGAVLGEVPERVAVKEIVGECYSASGAIQLAGLLALWRAEPPKEPVTALVTSVGRDGNVGCLVVRGGPR
jgi:3-oxoacyl-[acyl-carrier-protein] synthase II